MEPKPKDNGTFERKAKLRATVLGMIEHPVVMETHGGFGKLFSRVYAHIPVGVVLEKDSAKCESLAMQRPTWAVYECAAEKALAEGIGGHLEINFLDLDPYGSPWEAMSGFFGSARPFAPRMALVVNDGLRQKAKMGAAWHVHVLKEIAQRYGNNRMYAEYLEISRELLIEQASRAQYTLKEWTGYYCSADITHYAAILERTA